MTQEQAILKIISLLNIICPAYNDFQNLGEAAQIQEVLNIFAGSTPERQTELLGLLGASFQNFYNELTQEERAVLLSYFGIETSPPPYTDNEAAINAVMAGKPSLYCFAFETEAIFWFIAFCYSNNLSELEYIDNDLYVLWQEAGGIDGAGMNVWTAFLVFAISQNMSLYFLVKSFTAKFRE